MDLVRFPDPLADGSDFFKSAEDQHVTLVVVLQQTMTEAKRDLLDWTNPIGKCLESFITSLYNHV